MEEVFIKYVEDERKSFTMNYHGERMGRNLMVERRIIKGSLKESLGK